MEEANNIIPIIDRRFCNPSSQTTLTVKSQKGWFKSTLFNVVDVGGNLVFKVVKGGPFKFASRNLLLVDANSSPIATLFNQRFLLQWRVYKEKSTSKEDELCLITRGKGSRSLNLLMKNGMEGKKKAEAKFTVVKNFLPTFYKDEKVIADVVENVVAGGGGGFHVRIEKGVDAAFILALFIVHRESIFSDRPLLANAGGAGGGCGGGCGGGGCGG